MVIDTFREVPNVKPHNALQTETGSDGTVRFLVVLPGVAHITHLELCVLPVIFLIFTLRITRYKNTAAYVHSKMSPNPM